MLKNLLIVGLLLMAMRVAAVEITDTFDNDAVPQLAVAGKLEFDFHTTFMVARGSEGHALNWNGCGVFKGCFGDFGLDGSDENYPKYKADVDGAPAIIFDGNDGCAISRLIPLTPYATARFPRRCGSGIWTARARSSRGAISA